MRPRVTGVGRLCGRGSVRASRKLLRRHGLLALRLTSNFSANGPLVDHHLAVVGQADKVAEPNFPAELGDFANAIDQLFLQKSCGVLGQCRSFDPMCHLISLCSEAYRYNIQALRESTVASHSVDTIHWLLDRSIPFNRFVPWQLNERLRQFLGAPEIERLSDPDVRVARRLAALFSPLIFPGAGSLLRITQAELGYLVGLSRQRVNKALHHLPQMQLIRIGYGGVRVLDLAGLCRRLHAA